MTNKKSNGKDKTDSNGNGNDNCNGKSRREEVNIPPIAMRLRWVGHPARTTATAGLGELLHSHSCRSEAAT
ncbi:MAG TPA: hypothetical protein VIX42_09580 [Edaphobacter sp.]